MNWRRVERWATIALYTAASVAVVILLAEELLPVGSLVQWLAQRAAHYLTRLGDIGGGALLAFIFVALLIMGGIWLMVLIAEGVERLSTIIKEMRGRDEQLKAAAREAGREAGREEMRGIVRERLLERGINPDDILPPEDTEDEE